MLGANPIAAPVFFQRVQGSGLLSFCIGSYHGFAVPDVYSTRCLEGCDSQAVCIVEELCISRDGLQQVSGSREYFHYGSRTHKSSTTWAMISGLTRPIALLRREMFLWRVNACIVLALGGPTSANATYSENAFWLPSRRVFPGDQTHIWCFLCEAAEECMYAPVGHVPGAVCCLVYVSWRRVLSDFSACVKRVGLRFSPPPLPLPRETRTRVQNTAAATTNNQMATPIPAAMITVKSSRLRRPGNKSNLPLLIVLQQLLRLRWRAASIREAGWVGPTSVSFPFGSPS